MGNDDEFNSHSEDNQDLGPDSLRHSGLWSLDIGHTGNPSDHKHAAHRLQSVRPDSVVRWSILLNRTLLELRSELEHWSASLEPDIVLMLLVHHRGITAHIVQLFSFVTLTQVNLFRLRCSGIVSGFVLFLTTLSFRDIIVVSSLAQDRRRSHIRRGNSLPLLVLLLTAFPSLLLEKEKGNGTYLKKKYISLRSFNMTSV